MYSLQLRLLLRESGNEAIKAVGRSSKSDSAEYSPKGVAPGFPQIGNGVTLQTDVDPRVDRTVAVAETDDDGVPFIGGVTERSEGFDVFASIQAAHTFDHVIK